MLSFTLIIWFIGLWRIQRNHITLLSNDVLTAITCEKSFRSDFLPIFIGNEIKILGIQIANVPKHSVNVQCRWASTLMKQIWFMNLWREKNDKQKNYVQILELREISIYSLFKTLKKITQTKQSGFPLYAYNSFSFVSIFFCIVPTWHWQYGSLLLHKSCIRFQLLSNNSSERKVYELRFASEFSFLEHAVHWCELLFMCLWVGLVTHACGHVFLYIFSIHSKKEISYTHSQSQLFSVCIFHHHCISPNRTHHILERFLKTFKSKIRHVHSIFLRVSFFMVCMVISAVGWHTVHCYSATLCSEVNYIKLNAVYVLCTHPWLPQTHTNTCTQYQTFFMFPHKNVFNTKQNHMRPPPFKIMRSRIINWHDHFVSADVEYFLTLSLTHLGGTWQLLLEFLTCIFFLSFLSNSNHSTPLGRPKMKWALCI